MEICKDTRCTHVLNKKDPHCQACLANQKEADMTLQAERTQEKARHEKRLKEKKAHKKSDE